MAQDGGDNKVGRPVPKPLASVQSPNKDVRGLAQASRFNNRIHRLQRLQNKRFPKH